MQAHPPPARPVPALIEPFSVPEFYANRRYIFDCGSTILIVPVHERPCLTDGKPEFIVQARWTMLKEDYHAILREVFPVAAGLAAQGHPPPRLDMN